MRSIPHSPLERRGPRRAPPGLRARLFPLTWVVGRRGGSAITVVEASQSLFKFPTLVVRHRDLIRTLVVRELKARYLGSSFGAVWAILNPLIMLAVYTFVFSGVLKIRFQESADPLMNAFNLFCGMVAWNSFAESLHRCTMTVIENANLIKKTAFPSMILPVSVALFTFVNEIICLTLLVLALAVFQGEFHWTIVLFPLLAAVKLLFTVGFGYLFAAVNVFVRDFVHLIGLLITLWMFLTPVFYPVSAVKDFLDKNPKVLFLYQLNPMTHVISAYRAIFIEGRVPDLSGAMIFLGVTAVVFTVGYLLFVTSSHRFADEI